MTESVKARKETRYYVGRYAIANPKETEEVVHLNEYNNLSSVTDNFMYSEGFTQRITATRIANRLNQIEQHIAEDTNAEVKYHYFSYERNNDVRALDNYTRQTEEEATEE